MNVATFTVTSLALVAAYWLHTGTIALCRRTITRLGVVKLCVSALSFACLAAWYDAPPRGKVALEMIQTVMAKSSGQRQLSSNLDPKVREVVTRVLAAEEFARTGKLTEYVATDGTRRLFAPSEAEIALREQIAAYRADLAGQAWAFRLMRDVLISTALFSVLSGLVRYTRQTARPARS